MVSQTHRYTRTLKKFEPHGTIRAKRRESHERAREAKATLPLSRRRTRGRACHGRSPRAPPRVFRVDPAGPRRDADRLFRLRARARRLRAHRGGMVTSLPDAKVVLHLRGWPVKHLQHHVAGRQGRVHDPFHGSEVRLEFQGLRPAFPYEGGGFCSGHSDLIHRCSLWHEREQARRAFDG